MLSLETTKPKFLQLRCLKAAQKYELIQSTRFSLVVQSANIIEVVYFANFIGHISLGFNIRWKNEKVKHFVCLICHSAF